MELDLRIGAAFTRLQTLQLQSLGLALQDRIISYGRCLVSCKMSMQLIHRLLSIPDPRLRG